jgi:hypothetical protein
MGGGGRYDFDTSSNFMYIHTENLKQMLPINSEDDMKPSLVDTFASRIDLFIKSNLSPTLAIMMQVYVNQGTSHQQRTAFVEHDLKPSIYSDARPGIRCATDARLSSATDRCRVYDALAILAAHGKHDRVAASHFHWSVARDPSQEFNLVKIGRRRVADDPTLYVV